MGKVVRRRIERGKIGVWSFARSFMLNQGSGASSFASSLRLALPPSHCPIFPLLSSCRNHLDLSPAISPSSLVPLVLLLLLSHSQLLSLLLVLS